MTKDTGVFLPDEQEPQIPKRSPQSARANGDQASRGETAKAAHADPAKLSEQELKSAIIAAWKKHEELAKRDLSAPPRCANRAKGKICGGPLRNNDLFGICLKCGFDPNKRTKPYKELDTKEDGGHQWASWSLNCECSVCGLTRRGFVLGRCEEMCQGTKAANACTYPLLLLQTDIPG